MDPNGDITDDSGHAGFVNLSVRKRLNHRGPLSIDMSSAWYFITICADGHAPWVADEVKIGRAVAPRPPDGNAGRAVAPRPPDGNAGRAVAPRPPDGNAGRAVAPRPPHPTTSLETIAPLILREARENHNRGIWWLALFLVMPDHLYFIVNIGGRGATALPDGRNGGRGATALPGGGNGGRGATALPRVIANFKHLLSARYGLRFQRDFFDTRLRDDAHFAEEYDYILGNPVRKGLCVAPANWPHSIAFSRDGTEIPIGRADIVR